MLLTRIHGWVDLLAGLCFQAGLLAGLHGQSDHYKLGCTITSGCVRSQAVYPGKTVLLVVLQLGMASG